MTGAAPGFERATGVEADHRARIGGGRILYAYAGPIRLPEAGVTAVDRSLGAVARRAAPEAEVAGQVVGAVRKADRLLVVWRPEAAAAFMTARWATAGDLRGWYLTLSCVDPEAAGQGLFSTMLRTLLTERQGSFVACTTDAPPVRRALRRASPSRTLFPADGVGDVPPPVLAVGRSVLRSVLGPEAATGLGPGLDRPGWRGPGAGGAPSERGRLVLADLDGRLRCRHVAGSPHRPRTIGVTGTNGKTSVVEFGRQLSAHLGDRAASFGTLGVVTEIGRRTRPRLGVGPQAISGLARRLWELGTDVLWFEAFSYSLATGLVDEAEVDVGVLTQIDLDHLGVHGSPAAYRAAKLRLFEQAVVPGGTAVVDPDAAGAADVLAVCRRRHLEVVRVGPGGDVDLQVHPGSNGTDRPPATLVVGGESHEVWLPSSAPYQVANLLGALGAAVAEGATSGRLTAAVDTLTAAPGRLQRLTVGNGVDVVVDAAHNGSGVEATLRHLRATSGGRVHALIASVGTSDRNRWESMGEAASVLADQVVVTDESPYGCDPAVIRAGLLRGCPGAADIPDRREAIRWILGRSQPGDTVLLAGRADEDFRVTGAGREPYPTDAELVAEALVSAEPAPGRPRQ